MDSKGQAPNVRQHSEKWDDKNSAVKQVLYDQIILVINTER